MSNLNGLNGGGFWKRFWSAAAGVVGGIVAGPLGATLAALIVEYAYTLGKGGALPEYLEPQMDTWNTNEFTPFVNSLFSTLSVNSNGEYGTEDYVIRLNNVISKLATLQAYYEYKSIKATTTDQELLFNSKATAVGIIKDNVIQSYEETKINYPNSFISNTKSLTVSNISYLAPIYLTWGNSFASIVANIPYYYDAQAGKGGSNSNDGLPTGGLPTTDSQDNGNVITQPGTGYNTPPFVGPNDKGIPVKTPKPPYETGAVTTTDPSEPSEAPVTTDIKTNSNALKWVAGIVTGILIYKIGKNAK